MSKHRYLPLLVSLAGVLALMVLILAMSGCAELGAVAAPHAATAAVTVGKVAVDARAAARARLQRERLERAARKVCATEDELLESVFGVRAAVSIRGMCDELLWGARGGR